MGWVWNDIANLLAAKAMGPVRLPLFRRMKPPTGETTAKEVKVITTTVAEQTRNALGPYGCTIPGICRHCDPPIKPTQFLIRLHRSSHLTSSAIVYPAISPTPKDKIMTPFNPTQGTRPHYRKRRICWV